MVFEYFARRLVSEGQVAVTAQSGYSLFLCRLQVLHANSQPRPQDCLARSGLDRLKSVSCQYRERTGVGATGSRGTFTLTPDPVATAPGPETTAWQDEPPGMSAGC